MDTPILKIDGKRYSMGKIKAGTYRQVILLGEDCKTSDAETELIEDVRVIVKEAFSLTREQADQIEMEQLMPTYRKIKAMAENIFVTKAAEVPNEEGPEEATELPGPS